MTGDAGPLIAVLDYGIGNLRSAQKALEHVGADARLTADHDEIERAAGVVLPGVGAFGACIDALEHAGLADVAATKARAAASDPRAVPFLGICVGVQLLFEGSEEDPGHAGLGVLPGVSRRLTGDVKIPQMQWNQLDVRRPDPLVDGLGERPWVYFVHSYAVDTDPDLVVATCDYGGPVTAMVGTGGLRATQFHPEKSGSNGLALLGAFVAQCSGVPA